MEFIAETKYGKVEGFEQDNMNLWLGIPYAKAPVGELRFKRAQPCEPWNGVLEAKAFGNRPYQFTPNGKNAGDVPQSEDCLNLNVWAPKDARKAPVFVWLFGGGYNSGEGSEPSYGGDGFARDGVVYVNFNHRVGPLGYYNFKMYDESFDSNCAFSDILMAMNWIKENIEAFGGDADNITICGQSAGAGDVCCLLSSPHARGLFRKAIVMAYPTTSQSDNAQCLRNEIFFKQLGINEEDISGLKTMPIEQLQDAGIYVFQNTEAQYPLLGFNGPVVDDLLPQKIEDALTCGQAEGVDVIIGYCVNEGNGFYAHGHFCKDWATVKAFLKNNISLHKLPALREYYGKWEEPEAMKLMSGDSVFTMWAQKYLDAQCKWSTVYAYRYDFVTEPAKERGLLAGHGMEVEVALGTHGNLLRSFEAGTPKERMDTIRKKVHGAWVNFAKTGNPNGTLETEWRPYTEEKKYTMLLNDTCELAENLRLEVQELWKDIPQY